MPRETTISKVLLPLLDQYPSIDIPGLGNIGYRELPASLDKERHVVYPPMRTLSFSTVLTEENSVYDLLPETLSKKEIKQFNNEIDFAINELINLGKTRLPGVTAMVRREDGTIILEEISAQVRGPQQYLPVLQLSPCEHKAAPAPSVASLNPQPAKAETYVSPYNKDADTSKWKSNIGAVMLFVLALAAATYFIKQCQAPKSDGRDVIGAVKDSMQVGYARDDSTQMFENETLAKYQGVLSKEILRTGCTIVVGSYGERENALSRTAGIRAMGYDLLEVAVEKPYRAIIRFDCNKHDLDQYMLDIRANVEPKAWFLSPEGYDVSDQ